MFIIAKMMPIQYIADAEKDANMKSLSQEEAVEILSDMKIDIPVPKAAVTQRKRNVALDMAISALSCSEIPNSSDCISRKAAIDAMAELQGRASTKAELTGISKAWKKIKKLPSAQPDIIRCKDCKYWDTTWQNDYAPNYHYCPMIDGTHRNDFYCAYAERRTDE